MVKQSTTIWQGGEEKGKRDQEQEKKMRSRSLEKTGIQFTCVATVPAKISTIRKTKYTAQRRWQRQKKRKKPSAQSTIVMLTDLNNTCTRNLNRIFSMECLKLAIKWHYIHELFLFRMCLFFSFFICCWHCFLFWDESATRTKESNIKIISSTCIHCLC